MHERTERRIAETVATAWYGHSYGSRMDIALGTVATLSLLAVADPDGPDLATQWAELDDAELVLAMKVVWGALWFREPYLIEMARPIHDWLKEDPTLEMLASVRAIMRAAFRYGLLGITGHRDPYMRSDSDMLGAVLVELRAPGDRKAKGEFHTPQPVSDVIAQLVIGSEIPPAGRSFEEPSAGSGGMIRSAAQHIRSLGGNPANYLWSMTDIDRYAAAICAVNAVIWGLGPNVLTFCGDTLRHADGPQQAAEMRRQVLAHRDRVVEFMQFAAATRNAFHMLNAVVTGDIAA
ncbi:N-6 DNA methylase [Nocardia pseudovaccinii]|uniref:N-6 DNA methylase n=1 Tax=Nocardia pseudovaccinii TaxID=189540 RepID=UPI000AD313A5|nr:N-6 DNA methylase [Nocardia pseudovaccinii]